MSLEGRRKKWIVGIGLFGVCGLLALIIVKDPDRGDTWVEAIATVVLAAFALLQLDREERREKRHEREVADQLTASQHAAAARVGFLAFGLRRQILSWHRFPGQGLQDLPQWAEWAKGNYREHFDRAEARMDEISSLGPSLSSDRYAATRRAGVLFFAGTGRLNEYATVSLGPVAGTIVSRARIDLEELVDVLEHSLIPTELLEHEQQIEALRQQQIVG